MGNLLAAILISSQLIGQAGIDKNLIKESDCMRLETDIVFATVDYNSNKKPRELEYLKELLKEYRTECRDIEVKNKTGTIYLRFNHQP